MKFKSLFVRFVVFKAIIVTAFAAAVLYVVSTLPTDVQIMAVLGVFVVAMLLSVVTSLALSKNIAGALTSLVKAAQAIEHGEKSKEINLNRYDEFVALQDAINRLADRDKALREANHDPLTGLANRRFLEQSLEKMLNKGKALTLMFLDLDGFKPINDEHGHDVGDEALRMVADRLTACAREQDIVCRLGGDEFVMLYVGMTNRELIEERANKILEVMANPFWISGARIRMGVSIGIATAPTDGNTSEDIINAADESMYAAKQGGKNAFRFYS